ncbi:MAG: hypothetical protein GY794_15255 [bacterium]|nr:hypothetical protein [bacterium]
MKTAYRDFIDRVGEIKTPRGAKRQMVIDGIDRLLTGSQRGFRLSELEQICPGVSRDMVRHVLREQQAQGLVSCSGRGAGAFWSRGTGPDKGNQ